MTDLACPPGRCLACSFRPLAPVFGLLLMSVALGGGCRKVEVESGSSPGEKVATPQDPVWFHDVTEESGLNFVHDAGPTGKFFMPQTVGSGAALFDFDNDG